MTSPPAEAVDREDDPHTLPLRTVLVSQWFPPEPVRIPVSIAEALEAHGHEMTIMTGIPNFPDGVVQAPYAAWRRSSERVDGRTVERYPLYPSHDSSPIRRMLNYGSWGLSSALLGRRQLQRADVALVYSSPATAALAPALWKRWARIPYVLLIQDLWPDSVRATQFIQNQFVSRFVTRALTIFVNWSYRRAAHIAVSSPGMADLLKSRGIPAEKISLVYNWVDDAASSDIKIDQPNARLALDIPEDKFVITYAGTHGAAQGLATVVDAAKLLRHHSGITFLMVGAGIELEKLKRRAQDAQCDNIRFIGQVDRSRMPGIQAASDVQLASLVADELFEHTMPSKIQSILAAGRPLIVMVPGDAAEVTKRSGAGWVVAPGDAEQLASTVLEARSTSTQDLVKMGESGLNFYRKHMSRSIGATRLDSILRTAARGGAAWRRDR